MIFNSETKCLLFICLLMQLTSVAADSWDDISRLNRTEVQTIVRVKSEADVVAALQRLKPQEHIVISGTRHSQGGQIVFPGAVVLDMSGYNNIVSLSVKNKSIIVQSGTIWAQIQQAINPHGLSIKVMQSSNIFSIGGSLSANVHGRDPSYGPIIETVKSLKLVLASGDIVVASRQINPELFYAAIGGYGLIGIVLEVELELTDNLKLVKSTARTEYDEYPAYLLSNIEKLALHYGRCSIVKDDTFLRECYSINFEVEGAESSSDPLSIESNVGLSSLFFNFSRKSSIGKALRWNIQKKFIDVPG